MGFEVEAGSGRTARPDPQLPENKRSMKGNSTSNVSRLSLGDREGWDREREFELFEEISRRSRPMVTRRSRHEVREQRR